MIATMRARSRAGKPSEPALPSLDEGARERGPRDVEGGERLTVDLDAALADHLGVGSTSEARRLIAQGAVKIDGEAVAELDLPRARLDGALVQAGKRRFMRFRGA